MTTILFNQSNPHAKYFEKKRALYEKQAIYLEFVDKKMIQKQYFVKDFSYIVVENGIVIDIEQQQTKTMIEKSLRKYDTQFILNRIFHVETLPKRKLNSVALFVGGMINILLFTMKLMLGMQFKIISLISDAMNHLGDLLSNFVVFLGIKLALVPPDKKHPYGHGRIEYIANIVMSIFILFVGINVLVESFYTIISPTAMNIHIWIYITLIIALILKYGMFVIFRFLARKGNVEILNSISQDAKNDVFISLGILIAMIIYHLFKVNLDGYLGVGIAIFIIFSGIKIILEMIDHLIGVKHDTLIEVQIKQLLFRCQYTKGVHDFVLHRYGNDKSFGSVHVEVDANLNISTLHHAYDQIEKEIKKLNQVELVIHLDPIDYNDTRRLLALQTIQNVLSHIYPSYDLHDFRLHQEACMMIVEFDIQVDYQYQNKEYEAKKALFESFKKLEKYKIEAKFEYA